MASTSTVLEKRGLNFGLSFISKNIYLEINLYTFLHLNVLLGLQPSPLSSHHFIYHRFMRVTQGWFGQLETSMV